MILGRKWKSFNRITLSIICIMFCFLKATTSLAKPDDSVVPETTNSDISTADIKSPDESKSPEPDTPDSEITTTDPDKDAYTAQSSTPVIVVTTPVMEFTSSDKPEPKGHSSTVMIYSYDDNNDQIGPSRWNDSETGVLNATDNQNNCFDRQSWTTPLNIDTTNVVAPEEQSVSSSDEDTDEAVDSHKTLVIFVSNDIQYQDWEFGHPSDVYHGLEIRSPHLGTFQINDRYDQIAQAQRGVDEYSNYDFSYAAIFYCDTDKAAPERSMHQIDGQKFPLEIDFIFYSQPPRIGMNNVICFDGTDRCETVGVMISVLGEFGPDDNARLAPLIDAATRFEGPDFGTDDMDEDYVIPIHGPWSPTWILPDSSDYYYYEEGSFPVPPCWYISRVYVIKERIKISRKQLNALSQVRTKREKTTDGRMPCTFSVLQTAEDPQDIKYNQWAYEMRGEDGRPMTKEDQNRKDERNKASKDARMRALERKGIFVDDESSQLKIRSDLIIVGLLLLVSLSIFKLRM